MNSHEVSNLLQRYSKAHAAGAFATPTRAELDALPEGSVVVWEQGDERFVAVLKYQRRSTTRRDWLGDEFVVPQGATVATHLGRTERGEFPDVLLSMADVIFAYADDREVTRAMERARWARGAVQIKASSEVVVMWTRVGDERRYPAIDRTTIAEMPVDVSAQSLRARVLGELRELTEWTDDYPFYSDGSWGQVSLRGFDPDPSWGLKPSEMSKAWKAEHPDALNRRCDWTRLAAQAPALVELTMLTAGDWAMERVRLLRMAGRGGRGGRLGRHTDITDKASGTKVGRIARLHVPLITHPDVTMTCWELDGSARTVHLDEWRCYYLDARKPHAVTNGSGLDRVHLVIDVVVDSSFRVALASVTEGIAA